MTIVTCQSVSKRYGNTKALDSVTLELAAGPPIALIGPNGAGKTTLMSAICGYVKPSDGTINVLGQRPASAGLNGRVSALPQDAQFDPHFSVERQLRLYAELQGFRGSAVRREVARVLALVNLSDAGKQKPNQLSHGMRKRIAIAQALIGEPELVLLDEPTAGLDPASAKDIRDIIHQVSTKATFLVSSHNLDELEKLCRTVIHLDHGRVVETINMDDDTKEGYLTIKLIDVDLNDAQSQLKKLNSITHVSAKQQGDLVLQYDAQESPHIDQSVLKLLAENNWRYRHLIHGRSLEDAFFDR